MATTTQILFNSPALHSLKRDQLVKLCKIHSIKANGKNTELIERLKQRALELPPEAAHTPDHDDDMMEDEQDQLPGGMPIDSEDTDNVGGDDDYDMQDVVLTSRFSIPRPSEQWEVVMEDIAEADETMGTASSKNSLKTVSNGEFGTQSSKTSVSSSIKALATSLGIKRVASKSSHHSQDTATYHNPEGSKMPSFSPGKLFSTRARDSLAEHATPYADIPPSDSLPETDNFKFSTPDVSILGLDEDAPDEDGNGNTDEKSSVLSRSTLRMGMNAGVKSTIRLVSHPAALKKDYDPYAFMSPPKLPVIKTDFDIMMGTPGSMRTLTMWPASPRPTATEDTGERLYPKLPLDDDEQVPGGMSMSLSVPAVTPVKTLTGTAAASASRGAIKSASRPVDEPDMFSPSKPSTSMALPPTPTPGSSKGPRTTPFLFGSPLPRRDMATKTDTSAGVGVSNAAFDNVAKSVLEEMHRRLAETNAQKGQDFEVGHPPGSPSTRAPAQPIFSGLAFDSGTGQGAQDRFAKAHEAEFKKMDSIAGHYAARRPAPRKSDARGPSGPSRPVAGKKRRSSAAGARVISAGTRKRMGVPGGFGADDDSDADDKDEGGREDERDEEDSEARRSSKRMKITEGWDVHRGQRVSLAPPLPPAEEERKTKEREAVKRELDAAKARRRSSRGRPSIGAQPAKAKTSRFGFLASAKSLVRNVWNMGGNGKASKPSAPANAPPSGIPIPKSSQAPVLAPADKKGETVRSDTAAKSAVVPAANMNARKVSGSHSRVPSLTSTANKFLKPPSSTTAADAKGAGTVTSTKSANSRARSPIPSFNAPSGTVKSTTGSVASTARSRISSTSTGTATTTSRQTGRTSTVSSMGTRTSFTSGASTAVSSMGTRRSLASTNTLASTSSRTDVKDHLETKEQPSVRKRTSSLLAPTASSLAKTHTAARPSATGRVSSLPPVAEAQKSKRASVTQSATTMSSPKTSLASARNPMSPRPTRIFSQPLTNFASSPASSSSGTPVRAYHPSLAAAATSIMGSDAAADAASSPSKIPRPAVIPPKPKQLVARRPRISRSRVIAKLGAQRAAAAQGQSSLGSPSGAGGARTRSSMGARRSFGAAKTGRASAGSEVMRSAVKKRARQSEYMRRRSRAASENESVVGDN